MTEATDAFVDGVRRAIRKSLFRQFKASGLDQDGVTRAVATTSETALRTAAVADLATVVAAAGPVVAALEAAAPDDPVLTTFNTVKDGVATGVQDLLLSAEA
jgi:hypothetical protein